jgi:hypothetical protein
MATRNQLGTTIFAKVKHRASKGSRKKRIRPGPRQYTTADFASWAEGTRAQLKANRSAF